MKQNKLALILTALFFLLTGAAAIPEMPHHVYGDINDIDGPENSINVSFHYSGSLVSSTLTDSSGYYDIKIPYSSNYDGQELNIFVEDTDTGKGVTFKQGASEQVNYEGENIIRDSFTVSGTITKDSNGVNDISVKFYNDGNSISSTTTNSNGDYSIDIPFSTGYDGEELVLHVNGSETSQTTTFVTRGSDTLDYTISTSSDDTTNQEEEEQTDSSSGSSDNTDEEDDSSTTGTDDSSNDNSDSDSSTDESEGANVKITDISSSPQDPKVGETVQIYVTVTNTGDAATDHEVSITAGNEQLQKTVMDLSAGDTKVVKFEKQFDAEDTYSVSIGDQSHSVDVSASETNETQEENGGGLGFIQIMGIVGGLLMVIVIVYLFLDSRKKKDMDEEQKGALDAYKEKKAKEKGDSDGFGWKYANDD